MSNLGTASDAAAARMFRQADDGVGNWLGGMVSGKGTSPSQIIVTGILGLVPGLGQAMDARDLVFAIIMVVKSPVAIVGWIELVITLIGCVPAAGDTLKVTFKLMQQGHGFGRILEAASPNVRGNVEKYMRNINWKTLVNECKELLNNALSAFIDGLDSWVVKTVTSRSQVSRIVEELKSLQQRAPKMIDEVFAELKKLHANMMGHELPGTTAALASTSGKALKMESREVAVAAVKPAKSLSTRERKLLAKKNHDVKKAHVQPRTAKVSTKKKAEPKKQKWTTGVPAEHITDYYINKKHKNFRKSNNNGKLTEENSIPHKGLDHLWANRSHSVKPFVVGETKSSLFDSFRLMAALPIDLQDQFNVLKSGESTDRTKNDKPNIFHSENRDNHANQRIKIGDGLLEDEAIRREMNKANEETGLRTQMSHKWIENALIDEKLTPTGIRIRRLVKDYFDDEIPCPYQRWISLVTGRQLHKHQKSSGAMHDVQLVLDLPDNILDR